MGVIVEIRLNTLLSLIGLNYKESKKKKKKHDKFPSDETKNQIVILTKEWNNRRVKITDCLRSWLIKDVKVKSSGKKFSLSRSLIASPMYTYD